MLNPTYDGEELNQIIHAFCDDTDACYASKDYNKHCHQTVIPVRLQALATTFPRTIDTIENISRNIINYSESYDDFVKTNHRLFSDVSPAIEEAYCSLHRVSIAHKYKIADTYTIDLHDLLSTGLTVDNAISYTNKLRMKHQNIQKRLLDPLHQLFQLMNCSIIMP